MLKRIKKILCTVSLFIFVVLAVPAVSQAAEKTSTVNFPQDYNSVTVTITAETPGNYAATLISPKNIMYDFVVIDEYTLTCTVSDVKEGDWNVTITNPNGEVPKTTIKVERSKANESEAVDAGNITVGKDIVGLKIYFKDDNVVVEWSDESVDKISIQVVDLDTNETIANTTAEDKYYECPIPESTKNVSVNIVPTSSSSVSGATSSFTYEINNHPNATVTFPDGEYCNEDSVEVEVISNGNYGAYVEVNGEKALEESSIPSGNSKYEIPLGEDRNVEIKFYIVDENGNMRSTTKSYIKDTIAPDLSFEEEYDGLQTYDDTVTINGKVKNFKSISINGNAIDTTSDGTFEFPLSLHLGENEFAVSAIDDAGNETLYNINITMLKSSGVSKEIIELIGFVIIVVVVILVVIVKKHKKKRISVSVKIDAESKENLPVLDIKQELQTEEKRIKKVRKTSHKATSKKTLFDKEFVITLAVVVTVIFILVNFVVVITRATSGSMSPTIQTGDIVIYNRLAYVVRDVKRGDSISFKHDGDVYGKRVIGIAGDKISFDSGYVYINGTRLDESSYILDEDIETNCVDEFEVPDGYVFVLGDNREDSNDSRFWDAPYVSIDDIIGKQLLDLNGIFR